MKSLNKHRIGPSKPTVIMLEYGDYECPYSGMLDPIVEQLIVEFEHNLAFIYRHLPMVNIHPSAGLAAIASEAAHKQGKFWEMHHLLFKNQKSLKLEKIIELAKEIKLNLKVFLDDIENDDLWKKVQSNIESANAREVLATPAIFINGTAYHGPSTLIDIRNAIEREIERREQINHSAL